MSETIAYIFIAMFAVFGFYSALGVIKSMIMKLISAIGKKRN